MTIGTNILEILANSRAITLKCFMGSGWLSNLAGIFRRQKFSPVFFKRAYKKGVNSYKNQKYLYKREWTHQNQCDRHSELAGPMKWLFLSFHKHVKHNLLKQNHLPIYFNTHQKAAHIKQILKPFFGGRKLCCFFLFTILTIYLHQPGQNKASLHCI